MAEDEQPPADASRLAAWLHRVTGIELTPRQRAVHDVVTAAMLHRQLYGCHIEVGLRLGGNGWRCTAGDACPAPRPTPADPEGGPPS